MAPFYERGSTASRLQSESSFEAKFKEESAKGKERSNAKANSMELMVVNMQFPSFSRSIN